MLANLKNIQSKYRFSPRIDGTSLAYTPATDGGAPVASINSNELTSNRVAYWDGSKFKETGVSKTDIEYLSNVTAGNAQTRRAVTTDQNKDVAGLRNLGLTSTLTANKVHAEELTIGEEGISTEGDLNVAGDAYVEGYFKSPIDLYNTSIRYRNSAIIRKAVEFTDNHLVFGNSKDNAAIASSAAGNIYHKQGSNYHKIWTDADIGSGSGLDADTVDSLHASSFVRTDADSSINAFLSIKNNGLKFGTTPSGGSTYTERYKIGSHYNSDSDYVGHTFALHDQLTGTRLLMVANNGEAYIKDKRIWHDGNTPTGPGSGFNADKVDGYHASDFLKSNKESYLTNNLYVSSPNGSIYFESYNSPSDNRRFSIALDPTFDSGNGQIVFTHKSDFTSSSEAFRITRTSLYIGTNKVWHSGNDGVGSGLDADKLDGQHGSYYTDFKNIAGGSDLASNGSGVKAWQSNNKDGGHTAVIPVTICSQGTWNVVRYIDFLGNYTSSYTIDSFRFVGSIRVLANTSLRVGFVDFKVIQPILTYEIEITNSIGGAVGGSYTSFQFGGTGSRYHPVIKASCKHFYLAGTIYISAY